MGMEGTAEMETLTNGRKDDPNLLTDVNRLKSSGYNHLICTSREDKL